MNGDLDIKALNDWIDHSIKWKDNKAEWFAVTHPDVSADLSKAKETDVAFKTPQYPAHGDIITTAIWHQATTTTYFHRGCGCMAFTKLGPPWNIGDLLHGAQVLYSNGKFGADNNVIVCESCGKAVDPMTELIAGKVV